MGTIIKNESQIGNLRKKIKQLEKSKNELWQEFIKQTNYTEICSKLNYLEKELKEAIENCEHNDLELITHNKYDWCGHHVGKTEILRCTQCGYESHNYNSDSGNYEPKDWENFKELMSKYKKNAI